MSIDQTGPRTERGKRAQSDILAAAREILLERGLDAFSLREVARRAGYAPSALYNHFSDRDALIAALGMNGIEVLGAYMGAVPATLPAPQRLRNLADAYIRFAHEQPEQYRIVFDTLILPPGSWEHLLTVAWPFTLLVEACRDGLAADELSDPRAEGAGGLAYGLWALAHGTVMLSAHHLAALTDDLSTQRGAAFDAYIEGITCTERIAR